MKYINIYVLQNNMENNEVIYWKNFKSKIEKLFGINPDLIQVISDFDWTLTYIKNKKTNEVVPAIISILYNKWYLSEEYSKKAKELENIYIPIEKDENIPLETRKLKMNEWRRRHKELLVQSGLSKKHIDDVVDSGVIQLRDGYDKLFEILNNANIPITIFSASWLWTYAISSYLEKNNINYSNIHFVSNEFIWDDKWNAVSWKEPFITSLNKDETVISNDTYPELYEKIKNRKIIILLWNSTWDAAMAKDEDNDLVLRIWFLEDKNSSKFEKFKKLFDIVLVWDGWMDEIISIIKNIK